MKTLKIYLITLYIVAISIMTLFVTCSKNINSQITPKYFGMIIQVSFIGLITQLTGKVNGVKNTISWKLCMSICVILFIQSFILYGVSYQTLFSLTGMTLLFLWTSLWKIIDFKYVASIFVGLAFVLTIQGCIQYTGLSTSLNDNFLITGSFDNPVGFSSAPSGIFPLSFLFFKDRRKIVKYCSLLISFMMIVAIVLSESRSSMLSIVFSLLIYWILIAKPGRKAKVISTGICALLFVVLYLFKKDSADGRFLIWRCTFNMFMDKPVVGHGFGAFQAKYMLYQANYFRKNHSFHIPNPP